MKTKFAVKGLDRDGGDCECCGKVNLKKLVIVQIIRDGEEGEIMRVGTDCASKMCGAGSWTSAKTIETAARNLTLYPGIARKMILDLKENVVKTAS